MPRPDYEAMVLQALSDGAWSYPHRIYHSIADRQRFPDLRDRIKPILIELWRAGRLEHWTDHQGVLWFRRLDLPEPQGGTRPDDLPA